jgi:hypothetical protein
VPFHMIILNKTMSMDNDNIGFLKRYTLQD